MLENPGVQPTALGDFLNLIYGEATGYAYVALKKPSTQSHLQDSAPKWDQLFYNWPEQKAEIVDAIKTNQASHDVYFSPALFHTPRSLKENVKGASVVWVDLDGQVPSSLGDLPEPSLRVRSSDDTRQHWYWRLDAFTGVEQLERINRALTAALGADVSGWDANQVLRPIGTINHKRNLPVDLLYSTNDRLSLTSFAVLPEPPVLAQVTLPDTIPDIADVVAYYKIPTQLWELFKEGKEEGKRSEGLMALAYGCAEIGMADKDILSIVLNADGRWGKYSQRTDQLERLMDIVARVRTKHPYKSSAVGMLDSEITSLGFKSVLATKVKMEWVWQGLLQKMGFMVVSGAPGVGKSQFSLQAGAQFALGKDMLGRPVIGTHKIGFFSLEMNLVELKSILEAQAREYSDEELTTLEENYKFYPLGQSIFLNDASEQERVEKLIREENLTGVIIDSLGSSTSEDLSNEREVRAILNWVDYIRNDLQVFVWFIHHNRKASGDNRKPNKLSDLFGSQYIAARPSTVLCLWDNGKGVELIPVKVRMGAQPAPTTIHRNENLNFHASVIKVVNTEEAPTEGNTLVKPKEGGSDAGKGTFGFR